MAEQNKLTVRFESTLDSPSSNPLMISGPIELFGTADTVDDLYTDDANSELITAINESDLTTIVIFVNNVYDELIVNENSLPNRGAYFYLVDNRPVSKLDATSWQEILLGTHSHENIEVLNTITSDLLSQPGIVAVDENGNLEVVDTPNTLPDLPAYFQDRIEQLIQEPEEDEYNHLDAPLEDLADTYDWENPNHNHLAVGNCRDLYRNLIRDNHYLYIKNDMSLELEKDSGLNLPWIRLYADSINYHTREDDAIYPDLVDNKYIFETTLPVYFDENKDEIFLFDDEEVLNNLNSYITSFNNQTKKIIFAISNRADVTSKTDTHKITVLVVKDAKRIYGAAFRVDFLEALSDPNSGISLDIINSELLKLYVKGMMYKKNTAPKLYLTTDEQGNVVWDNTLLPTQSFFAESKRVADIASSLEGMDSLTAVFQNVFYNIKTDFPILLIDGIFNFKLSPYKITETDVIYKIPISGDQFSITTESDLTLIVIKNTAQQAVTAELARNYVSKADAVEILSRGKLNLSDYVRRSELNKFAIYNHRHSQYSLKSHNHDYKYANFHHTHPELALLISRIKEGVSTDDVNNWLNELHTTNMA